MFFGLMGENMEFKPEHTSLGSSRYKNRQEEATLKLSSSIRGINDETDRRIEKNLY